MNATDFECVAYGADHYCINCLPLDVSSEDPEVHPIFASDAVDVYPVCCVCQEQHTYMTLNIRAEGSISFPSRWRTLKTTSPSGKTLFQCRSCGRIDIAPDKSCLQSPKCATFTEVRFFDDQLELTHRAISEMSAEQRQRFLRHIIEFVCMHCGMTGMEPCTCLEKKDG